MLANIAVGKSPRSFTYDRGNGFVYVGNWNGANVSILSGFLSVGSVPVGSFPTLGDYDPVDGYVYSSNAGSSNVSVISGMLVVGTPTVGPVPLGGVYNTNFGWFYVPNAYSDTVSVISGITTLSTITVGTGPEAEIYDPATGLVYVANAGSNNVSVVTGVVRLANIPVGNVPTAFAYDGAVYVANNLSNNVTVLVPGVGLNLSISVGIGPIAEAYDAGNGLLYVANWASNTVSVISKPGLVSTVHVGTGPRALAVDSATGHVYVANQGSANVSVISGTTLLATIPVGSSPDALVYDGGNGFMYVANEISNNVTVIGPPAPSIDSFLSNPPSIPLGDSTVFQVAARNGSGGLSYLYSNLPSGCASANASLLLCTPSVSGSYTVKVNVTDGAGRSVSRTASLTVLPPPPGEFPVTFTESYLPSGTNWSITLGGSTQSSTTRSTTFIDPNGTYSWSAGTIPGYYPSPRSGTVLISGAAKTVTVSYVAIPRGNYFVWWTESGLPVGTNWSVTLGGMTRSSTGATILFTEPNGSFLFTVSPVLGYIATPSSGTLVVSGAEVTRGATFSSTSAGGGSNVFGLTLLEWYALVGGIVAAVVISVAVVLYRRRRPPPTPQSSPPTLS